MLRPETIDINPIIIHAHSQTKAIAECKKFFENVAGMLLVLLGPEIVLFLLVFIGYALCLLIV